MQDTEICTGVGPYIEPPADPGHGGCDCDYLQTEIDKKQDKLTAGENITISDDGTISATGGGSTYTAGTNIDITDDVISAPDVYTKAETDALIDAIETGEFVVVDELPETGEKKSIYLVPKTGGGYTEWAYVNDTWEEIGDTDIDLSGYATTQALEEGLADKQDTLTAGTNVTIENDTISAKDTTYSPIPIIQPESEGGSQDGYIDVNLMSSDDVPMTLMRIDTGEGLLLSVVKNGEAKIDVDTSTIATKEDLSDYLTCDDVADCDSIAAIETKADNAQTDATTALAGVATLETSKQDALTAGDNVTITNGVISATDTTYEDATTTQAGLMSSADKTKLDSLKAPIAGSHITIAEDGTISAECCTKEELLEILGYEEITISKTDADGKTVTAHVLGYVDEPAETRGALYLVNAKTSATADNIKVIADGVTVLDVSDVTFEYAGDESNPVYYFSPGFTTDASTLTVEITNFTADGVEVASGTYTAYHDSQSKSYMVEESVGVGGFLTIVTMFEGA